LTQVTTDNEKDTDDESPLLSHGASARTMRRLREWIDSGVLSDGQPLPSERILAQRLAVNPKTVRNAVGGLVTEGLVQVTGKRLRIVRARRDGSPLMSNTIAVLTADPNSGRNVDRQTGFSSHLTFGALDEIQAVGRHALAINPAATVATDIGSLIEHRPLGVVAIFKRENWTTMAAAAEIIRSAGIPVVVYGDGPGLDRYDRVVSDHESGGGQLTRLLLSLGRKRILCFWPDNDGGYWLPRRYQGYLDAMAESGIVPMPLHDRAIPVSRLTGDGTPDEADFANVSRLFAGNLIEYLTGPKPIDAIMLVSDGDVAPVAAACRLLDKEPGRDISIVGYDNFWMDAAMHPFDRTPPCATVDKLNVDMGAALIRLLIDRIDGKLPGSHHLVKVTPRLVMPC